MVRSPHFTSASFDSSLTHLTLRALRGTLIAALWLPALSVCSPRNSHPSVWVLIFLRRHQGEHEQWQSDLPDEHRVPPAPSLVVELRSVQMWDEPIPGTNSQAHDMKARLEPCTRPSILCHGRIVNFPRAGR